MCAYRFVYVYVYILLNMYVNINISLYISGFSSSAFNIVFVILSRGFFFFSLFQFLNNVSGIESNYCTFTHVSYYYPVTF